MREMRLDKDEDFMRFISIMFLLLSGCVSLRAYRDDTEAEYHRGRMDVIKKVAVWTKRDLSIRDLQRLIEKLKAGEMIWLNYAKVKYECCEE